MSAINTLSIYAKLSIAGISGRTNESKVQNARENLLRFVSQLQVLLANAEKSQDGTIVGADPQFGELAAHYLSEQQKPEPLRAKFYTISLSDFKDLISSHNIDDFPALLTCLRDLRSLVEQNFHSNVVDILGDL
jgi:hypothetical protein